MLPANAFLQLSLYSVPTQPSKSCRGLWALLSSVLTSELLCCALTCPSPLFFLQTAVFLKLPSVWSPPQPSTSIAPTSPLSSSPWRCPCGWAAPGRRPASLRAAPRAPPSARAHRRAVRAARPWAPPQTAAQPVRTGPAPALRPTSCPASSGWHKPWSRSCSLPCPKRHAWRRRGWTLSTWSCPAPRAQWGPALTSATASASTTAGIRRTLRSSSSSHSLTLHRARRWLMTSMGPWDPPSHGWARYLRRKDGCGAHPLCWVTRLPQARQQQPEATYGTSCSGHQPRAGPAPLSWPPTGLPCHQLWASWYLWRPLRRRRPSPCLLPTGLDPQCPVAGRKGHVLPPAWG